MTIAKEVVYALHQRLKDLSVDATPDQLAYLAKSLESIAGQSTVLDIVEMTDAKLKELLDSATSHLSELDTSKTNALVAISELEKKSLKKIDEKGTANLSLLDTRKDTNIAAINSTGTEQLETLKGVVKQYETAVDVPSDSSIMKEIRKRNMVEPGSLPFVFGVLSRFNDEDWTTSHDHGYFKSELGRWYNSNADNMLQLLAGSNKYDCKYSSFYRPPQLYFFSGNNGKFTYRQMFSRYSYSSDQYNYPYALLGVVFVKNITNRDITRTLNFSGSSNWHSEYGGASLFIAVPNNTNANKRNISAITWENVYSYSTNMPAFSNSVSVTVPQGKTVAVLLYTSAYYGSTYSSYYSFFMFWSMYNFRSNFLTAGLEVDVERTLRAWQCPGLENTYQIWQ